jgi:hypothetical protein
MFSLQNFLTVPRPWYKICTELGEKKEIREASIPSILRNTRAASTRPSSIVVEAPHGESLPSFDEDFIDCATISFSKHVIM